jgi:hypothetical protein
MEGSRHVCCFGTLSVRDVACKKLHSCPFRLEKHPSAALVSFRLSFCLLGVLLSLYLSFHVTEAH